VDQLVDRVRSGGVTLETERSVTGIDAEDGWEEVILATGGQPDERPDDRTFGSVTVTAIASSASLGGDHVLVVDEEGSWTSLAIADHVIRTGRQATLVCGQPALAWRVPVYSRPALLARLQEGRFAVELLSTPARRAGADVICVNTLDGRETVHRNVTATVFVRPPIPRLELVDDFRRRGAGVTVIGDAYAPRSALEAAFEGRRAGFEVSRRLLGVSAASMKLRCRL
jgi:hypothetical protein